MADRGGSLAWWAAMLLGHCLMPLIAVQRRLIVRIGQVVAGGWMHLVRTDSGQMTGTRGQRDPTSSGTPGEDWARWIEPFPELDEEWPHFGHEQEIDES